MRTKLVACAALLAVATAAAGQDQQKKKSDSNKPVITVTGCVDGNYLRVTASDPVGSYTERYRLIGPKQLLKEISAQHNRHQLEVTGAVTDVTGNSTHRGKTIEIGKKTRITTGAKDVPQVPTGSDATLEVQTYRELKESCR